MPPKAKAKPEHLRAVAKDEAPPAPETPKKPPTLDEAIEQGDYLEILRAQRRQITTALPTEKGPALAALHRQLSILSKEIAQLEAKAKQEVDENGHEDEDTEEGWDGTWPTQATP